MGGCCSSRARGESGSWDQFLNSSYPGLEQLNAEPAIFRIPNFLSPQEVKNLIEIGRSRLVRAPVVANSRSDTEYSVYNAKLTKGRTSSTAFLEKELVPWLLDRVSQLTNKPPSHMERPQVGHYNPGEHYAPHFDAVDMASNVGRAFNANGGQRLVTVLCYLNSFPADGSSGGSTSFCSLPGHRVHVDARDGGAMSRDQSSPDDRILSVTPVSGTALVFFPGKLNGELDRRLLHTAESPLGCEKHVAQVWIRQTDYEFSGGVGSDDIRGKRGAKVSKRSWFARRIAPVPLSFLNCGSLAASTARQSQGSQSREVSAHSLQT